VDVFRREADSVADVGVPQPAALALTVERLGGHVEVSGELVLGPKSWQVGDVHLISRSTLTIRRTDDRR
jgi:hypothetical protein